MKITSASFGPFDNNSYLLADADEVVLVDAAQDAPALLDWIDGRRVSAIVTTHRHPDHVAALREVARVTGARLLAGAPDAEAVAAAAGREVEGLWDGDVAGVGGGVWEVIGLVGHTPGGIALAFVPDAGPATIISGDSLFPGGVGKTRTPEEFASLLGGVRTKLFDRFGDDTAVLPGHGLPTTLGAERPHLDEWKTRGW